jgi:hypothetical protein
MADISNVTPANEPVVTKTAEQAPKEDVCCIEFTHARIESFDENTVTYKDKLFVKDRVWCFLHVPINFDQAMKRACAKIEKADAAVPVEDFVMLSDMCSPWSTGIYLSVSKDDVPDAEVVKLSGTFLTKVFEGPYSKFGAWIKEMKAYVRKEKGEDFDVDACDMYAFYATCPGCAKKYGKNYTILFVKAE